MAHTIIVDADVAGSSGDETATVLESVRCRDALKVIRAKGLRIGMPMELIGEWMEHGSKFARTWMADMVDKKRVESVILMPEDELRANIEAIPDAGVRGILQKDLHVAEGALQTDGRVVSKDTTCRGHFRDLCGAVARLGEVHWVSPLEDGCLDWLDAGAPDDDDLRLKNL